MLIHVVQEGETVDIIAEKYGVSAERLILENEIRTPNRLVVGETLVILYPKITYIIQEGDTLVSIAIKYGVPVMQLLRNNPYLSNRDFIYPGETIVISYKNHKITELSTNGYAYPFINKGILKKTLPFLTYLTIYSYYVTAEVEVSEPDDEEMIQIAKEYGVAPIMMITSASKDQAEEINVTRSILLSEEKQNMLIDYALGILKSKGYYGVNITTPYLYPQDQNRFIEFITKFSNRVKSEGFKMFVTISLNVFDIITSAEYIGIDYERLTQVVDFVMHMPYEWGNMIGIPTGLMSFDAVKNYLGFMAQQIPPEKSMYGVPILGYVWERPYIPCITKGQTITHCAAIDLAGDVGAVIAYDEITKSAYFQYNVIREHIVRFRDARSVDAYANLTPEFGFNGIGIWNVMNYSPQLWLVINSKYDIEKILL